MPVGEVTNAETPELYMSSASAAALRIAIAGVFRFVHAELPWCHVKVVIWRERDRDMLAVTASASDRFMTAQ
jgi:hypothetical protein